MTGATAIAWELAARAAAGISALGQAEAVVDPDLVDTCGEDPGFWCELVWEATGNEAASKAVDFFVARPLKIILILLVAFVVNQLVRRAIRRFVDNIKGVRVRRTLGNFSAKRGAGVLVEGIPITGDRAGQRAETIGTVLRSTATVLIYGLALLIALAELEIELGPLIAGAGIAGVALGFGAQSLVKDFLSGMFMLLEDQYGVGDVIDVGEANGVVEAITLRVTRLRDINGIVWHVPNGEIRRVGNKSQNWSRAVVDVSVAYDTDVAAAKDCLLRTAERMAADEEWREKFLEAPEVWGVEQLAADGITIRLVAKVVPLEQWNIQRELRQRIKDAFDAEGIEIPFPQRSVWVRGNQPDALS